MRSITHRSLLTLTALLCAAVLGACTDAPVLTEPAAVSFDKKPTSPTKYSFTGESVIDADGTTLSGVTIRATSKQNDDSDGYTVCEYSTATEEYLGQLEAAEFQSAGEIEQFCIDSFASRQIS